MIRWVGRRLHARRSSDEGIGLVLVIGITTVITSLIVASTVISMSALRSSTSRVTYENALQTAENGIDFGLSRLQRAFDEYNSDYPIPNVASTVDAAPYCVGAPVVAPTFSDEAAEKAWARTQLLTIAANSACRQRGGSGEWVIVKPSTPLVNGAYPKYGKVYSMGFVPSYADWAAGKASAKERLLKAEYIFMPYRPTYAILTGGSVCLSSSTYVGVADGIDPSVASVHSNGSVCSSGNPTVTGTVTSTGTSTASSNNFVGNSSTGGAVTTATRQRVPSVSAESFYFQAYYTPSSRLTTWYDLCPDGTVRAQSAAGPCTAATSLNGGTLPFRGWSYTSSSRTWVASSSTQDGTYYAHEGNIDVGPGNGTFNNITLVASAEDADDCANKKYGNVEWDHFTIKAPGYTNMFMFADSDLVTHSNFTAGSKTVPVQSGMFVAGDQMSLQTSSAGAVGSVVTGDQCTTGNPDLVTTSEIKNPSIYYDPHSDSPFTSIINTTLWLEYTD